MDYCKLILFFDEYIAHYKEFLEFELNKLDMINAGKIEELSNSLQQEQAFIMKTNAFEAKRLKLLESNSEATFEDIVNSAPENYKKRLGEQHAKLTEVVYKIKEINELASTIVTERLRRIERKTASLNTYNGLGSVRSEPRGNLISKNI